MSILFLDIDGVMNTNNTALDRQGRNGGIHSWPWHYSNGKVPSDYDPGFTRDAVKVLNHIVARSGAKVVISSSWRDDASTETFNDWLELPHGTVIGKTPSSWNRGAEILAWLKVNAPAEPWVAIDDTPITFDPVPIDSNHLELTTGYVGLTGANEASILEKLEHFKPVSFSSEQVTLTHLSELSNLASDNWTFHKRMPGIVLGGQGAQIAAFFTPSEDSPPDTQAINTMFAVECVKYVRQLIAKDRQS